MKKGLILLLLLQVAICAKGQIVEPEYIGQAYVLLQNGQRVELDSELGYVSANTNTTTHAATTRHNIWGLFNPLLSASGYSVAQSYGKSVDYLNLPGESSPNQFRVREPFSIILRLESNAYLPETQIKVVRFVCDKGERHARSGQVVPFHAVKAGKSSYQIVLDKPFYGEYGVVYKNDMDAVPTFSLGYSDDDVQEYVAPFLESGSIEMVKYLMGGDVEIFDREQDAYIDIRVFKEKYGSNFAERIIAEYKHMQKILAKERKAQKKAQRLAKRKLKKNSIES